MTTTTDVGRGRLGVAVSLLTRPAVGVLVLAIGTVLVWARPVLGDFTGARLSNPGDSESFAWYLGWNVHAVLSGQNPFSTPNLYAPEGMDLGNAISIPAVSLLVAPVTLVWGATAAYNVAFLAAVLSTSAAVYLLAREVSGSAGGALVAGSLTVLSPYFAGHALGHLNMMWVFGLPTLAWLVVRWTKGRLRRRWLVLGVALVVSFTLGASTELVVTQALFALLGFVVGFLSAPTDVRRRLMSAVPWVALGGLAGGALALPVVLAAFSTGVPDEAANPPAQFSTDVTNLFAPTPNVLVGDSFFQELRTHWLGNVAENTAYVPVTLLVVAVAAVVWIRNRWVLGLAAYGLVGLLLSFGPSLTVAGVPTVPMPWRLAELVPGLNHALPARFSAFVFMALTVVVAVAWSHWRAVRQRAVLAVAAATSLVLLLPSPSLGWPVYPTVTAVPPYVSSGGLADDLATDENVLVLPSGQWGPGMRWMEELDFSFRMPTGNGGGAALPPMLEDPTARALFDRDLGYDYGARLLPYLQDVGVSVVIVDQQHPEWKAIMDVVVPAGPRDEQGAWVYDVT